MINVTGGPRELSMPGLCTVSHVAERRVLPLAAAVSTLYLAVYYASILVAQGAEAAAELLGGGYGVVAYYATVSSKH